ncbi:MAG TPA: class IV adenylate cyclase [Elusimicrobiales bacterium]|nr:class IV adenylate cyclase [Elusimicrobiales bacterium]
MGTGSSAAVSRFGAHTELIQTDTFFNCPEGRLKLRETSGEGGQLIYYRRPDLNGPKRSVYFISPAPDPAAAKALLESALGASKTVRKKRRLFLSGRTRIHFDEVEGLGRFLELEVVLGPGQTEAEGEAIAKEMMESLGIAQADLVPGAYADML